MAAVGEKQMAIDSPLSRRPRRRAGPLLPEPDSHAWRRQQRTPAQVGTQVWPRCSRATCYSPEPGRATSQPNTITERVYLIWRVVCQAGRRDFSHLALGVSGCVGVGWVGGGPGCCARRGSD